MVGGREGARAKVTTLWRSGELPYVTVQKTYVTVRKKTEDKYFVKLGNQKINAWLRSRFRSWCWHGTVIWGTRAWYSQLPPIESRLQVWVPTKVGQLAWQSMSLMSLHQAWENRAAQSDKVAQVLSFGLLVTTVSSTKLARSCPTSFDLLSTWTPCMDTK